MTMKIEFVCCLGKWRERRSVPKRRFSRAVPLQLKFTKFTNVVVRYFVVISQAPTSGATQAVWRVGHQESLCSCESLLRQECGKAKRPMFGRSSDLRRPPRTSGRANTITLWSRLSEELQGHPSWSPAPTSSELGFDLVST